MENFLDFEPDLWNCAPVLKSSNCYQYMLNYIDLNRINECHEKLKDGEKNCGQIGIACRDDKCRSIDDQCERFKYAILNDNIVDKDIYEVDEKEICPRGYYKGVLLFAPLKDKENAGYHFMREDSLNNWSHKFAYGKATNRDLSDKKINYPLNSDLDYNYNPDPYSNYSKLCGTFCIEESDISNDIRNKLKDPNFCKPN